MSSYDDFVKRRDKIAAKLSEKNCLLLSTTQDIQNQCEVKFVKPYHSEKIRFVAPCGHENNLLYAAYVNRKRLHLCGICHDKERNEERINNAAEKRRENESFVEKNGISRNIKCEYDACQFLIKTLQNEFDIVKPSDNCLADLIVKPKYFEDDDDGFLGIQIKSTEKMDKNNSYNFSIKKKDYQHCVIICVSLDLKDNVWLFKSDVLKDKMSIKIHPNSKYNKDKVNIDALGSHLMFLYEKYPENLRSIKEHDIPKNERHFVEHLFRKNRIEKLPGINFVRPNYENDVYDFIIDGLKVQEKIGDTHFHMNRNGGLVNGKYTKVPYKEGQNDIYWYNVKNEEGMPSSYFYMIPEYVLIEKGIIANASGTRQGLCFVKLCRNEKTKWYSQYLLNYEKAEETTHAIKTAIKEIKVRKEKQT